MCIQFALVRFHESYGICITKLAMEMNPSEWALQINGSFSHRSQPLRQDRMAFNAHFPNFVYDWVIYGWDIQTSPWRTSKIGTTVKEKITS